MTDNAPYLFYKELLPDSNIISATFFSCYNSISGKKQQYFCTVTSSTINIYKLKYDANETSGGDYKLKLLRFERLFGRAVEVKAFSRSENFNLSDILLVALDEAKVVAVEYIVEENILKETVICNLEGNALGAGADLTVTYDGRHYALGHGMEPLIEVNNDYHILAISVYGESILFVKLNRFYENSNEDSSILVKSKLLCNLAKDAELIGPIVDIAFVSGYSNPTCAVLQHEQLLPIGHAAKAMNTCSLSVLAIDLDHKSIAVLWRQTSLPHDCLRLVELQLAGSVAVISQNAFLVAHQEMVQGLAMNGFAAVTVSQKHIQLAAWPTAERAVELDASRWVQYGHYSGKAATLMGILKDGGMIFIRLVNYVKGLSSSLGIEAVLGEETASSSCFCHTNEGNMIFIGSKQSHSILYKLEPARLFTGTLFSEDDDLFEAGTFLKSAFIPTNGSDSPKDIAMNPYLSEETELYGTNDPMTDDLSSDRIKHWIVNLKALDVISSLGPVMHGLITRPEDTFSQIEEVKWNRDATQTIVSSNSAASYIAERECKDAVVIASGLNKNASLHRIFTGIALSKIGIRNFPGARSILSLPTKYRSLLFVSYANKTRVFQCEESSSGKPCSPICV